MAQKGKESRGESRESSAGARRGVWLSTLDSRPSTNLVFRHSLAGFFEDLPLAFGQTLNSVLGNFVEDGVHFTFHKFVGGQVLIGFVRRRAPERAFARAGANQLAGRGAADGEFPV